MGARLYHNVNKNEQIIRNRQAEAELQTDRAHVRDAISGQERSSAASPSAPAPAPSGRAQRVWRDATALWGWMGEEGGGDATAMTGAGEETDDRYLGLATCVFPACAPAPPARRRPSDPPSPSPFLFLVLFPSLYLHVSFEPS